MPSTTGDWADAGEASIDSNAAIWEMILIFLFIFFIGGIGVIGDSNDIGDCKVIDVIDDCDSSNQAYTFIVDGGRLLVGMR